MVGHKGYFNCVARESFSELMTLRLGKTESWKYPGKKAGGRGVANAKTDEPGGLSDRACLFLQLIGQHY